MKILLAGASGLAMDIIDTFRYENYIRSVTIFDNISPQTESHLYGRYPILTSEDQAKAFFEQTSRHFIVAVGSPAKRKYVAGFLEKLGGSNFSFFSSQSLISQHTDISENGVIIQINCQISSNVFIDEGTFLNVRCMIGHDVKIGKYTTLSPDVKVLGNVTIGDDCVIATGTTIMPKVTIGNNVKIGVNKVITDHIPDNTNLF
jgi:sugar O-acyltransferase (sialic acid O-acetyltransferase NeuD family)